MKATQDGTIGPKRKLRWYQFSLKTLLLLMVMVALWMGGQVDRARRNRNAMALVREMGGYAWNDRQEDQAAPDFGDDSLLSGRLKRLYRSGLRKMFGDEVVRDVLVVDLSGTRVTDADLSKLRKLTQLQWLGVADTQVTDEGLVHLKRLTKIQWLDLSYTRVTADGLSRLSGLTNLEWLDVEGTNVGEKDLGRIKRTWPGAEVGISAETATLVADANTKPGFPQESSVVPPESVWVAYTKNPYSKAAFTSLMRAIGQDPTKDFSAWYISGVFRAKRKGREPLWVVQIYDGTPGVGFNLGCLVVLGPSGKHLRTIERERIQWSLSAPNSEWKPLWNQIDKKQVLDLPELNGDSNAEIPTQRWEPTRGTSIYLTDSESIPCVFCIEIDSSPLLPDSLVDISAGYYNLQYRSASERTLYLVTPICRRMPLTPMPGGFAQGGYAPDPSQPARTLVRFKWSQEKGTFVGPARGPKGLWKVRDPR